MSVDTIHQLLSADSENKQNLEQVAANNYGNGNLNEDDKKAAQNLLADHSQSQTQRRRRKNY